MINYSPVPGKIYDLIFIGAIHYDYKSFTIRNQNISFEATPKITTEIHQFIRRSNEIEDKSISILFSFQHDLRLFWVRFIMSTHSFFSFQSVQEFFLWLESLDPTTLLTHFLSFLDNQTKTRQEYEALFTDYEKLSEFISALDLEDSSKYQIISLCLSPKNCMKKIVQAFYKMNEIMNELEVRYSDYMHRIKERLLSEEEITEVTKYTSFNWNVKKYDSLLYSLSFVDDSVVHCQSVGSQAHFILGVNAGYYSCCFHERIDLVSLGSTLSDQRRIDILNLLENGERYATEIAQILKIPNNTLFYHLNQLLAANLIATRISGRKTFYSLKSKTFKAISDYFENYYKIIAEKEKENEMLNSKPDYRLTSK